MKIIPTSVTAISKKRCLLQKDHLSGCLGDVELTAVPIFASQMKMFADTQRNLAATGVPLTCV